MKEILDRITQVFTSMTLFSVLDILLISVIVYFLLLILKKQNSLGVVKYLAVLLFFFALVIAFKDYLPQTARVVIQFGLLFIAIVFAIFPQEFRRLMWKASISTTSTSTSKHDYTDDELRAVISEIIKAVQNLSKKNIGALLVITDSEMPSQIIESGTKLDATLSSQLLESIFITKGPLHDGAVIIKGNRLVAAGCFLPLTQNLSIPKELGTRHRAAVGVSEATKVTAITVSEETGVISVAKDGTLSRYFDTIMLNEKLEQVFKLKEATASKKKRGKN